jgi:hypothetical protein
MKSGSGNQEPVNGHGQREDSKNGADASSDGAPNSATVPAAIPLPEPPAPSSAGSSPSSPSLDSAWPFGAGTVSSAAVDCKEVFDRLVRAQAAINEAGRGSAKEGEKKKKKPEVEQVMARISFLRRIVVSWSS